MSDLELRGERVLLRSTVPADTPVLDAIVREPEVARWWPPPEAYAAMLAVVVDGEVIGAIQFSEESDPEFRHAGIDLFLSARWHGQGLGPDAVRTLARWLIAERGHHRLVIDPAAANTTPSAATARSASPRSGSCAPTGATTAPARGRTACSWTCWRPN